MTLHQLKAFLAAATNGSFTAAATQLHTTQASVSELIKRLEDEVGLPLFSRGARQLVVTPAGVELQPFAERAVAAAEGGAEAIRRMRSTNGGTATLGLLRSAHFYLLSDLVEEFHRRHPTVRVRMFGLDPGAAVAAVTAGHLEAALVVLPINDTSLTVTPLLRDEVLYASRDPQHVAHPVTVEQLCQGPLVVYDAHVGWSDLTRRQLLERTQLAGLQMDCRIEVEHVESALDLVLRGAGDTIVNQALRGSPVWPPGLLTAPFAAPLHNTIALIQRPNTTLTPATRELVALARRMLVSRGSRQDVVPGAALPAAAPAQIEQSAPTPSADERERLCSPTSGGLPVHHRPVAGRRSIANPVLLTAPHSCARKVPHA